MSTISACLSAYRPQGQARTTGHVDASVSSNTYGTSLWGSSSKGPAGMGQGANVRRSDSTHSRNSFVSVSDISDDEDLDLENI